MQATQERPEKKCDLVMKGGVTSGIVYPKAITRLSKEYQFSSIGGTSAGAIAASVTAAAEYARANGNIDVFDKLDDLPDQLGKTLSGRKHSNLFGLFQPQREMRGLFAVAVSGLGKTGLHKWLAIVWTCLSKFPLAATIGIVPAVLTILISISATSPSMRFMGFALAIVIGLVGMILGLILGAVLQARTIPNRGWGICSGMTENNAPDPALVPWLAGYLDKLARKSAGTPLTFGDLRAQGINLVMIATNLTNGKPYSLPFGEHTHFYFKGSELREFFPDYVVKWMERNPGTRSTRDKDGQVASEGLSVLPDSDKLPVIIAVRMSLSFPFLFCPVPLYAVDFGFGPKSGDKHVPEPSFFVDGGLTSNFPLNLFDKPLPRWPTFGINLRDKDGRHQQDTYMVCSNGGGLEEWWTRFDVKRGFGGLLDYFGLLFDTSRNWRDNLQMNVPGYRDRIVHIGLDPANEGGMNLEMSKDVIKLLTDRGNEAGCEILSRYSPTSQCPQKPDCVIGLENQKWIRFRSFMELLEEVLLSMEGAVEYSGFGEPTYRELLQRIHDPSYQMSDGQKQYANDLLNALLGLVPAIQQKRSSGESFETRVPKPEPDLKVTPHF